MANKRISSFNQFIEVRKLTEGEQPDGTPQRNWDLVRFSTKFTNIKAASTNQHYAYGMSEKDTLYVARFEYSPDRAIAISDRVLWDNKILLPVGDCVIISFESKKFFEQKLKHTSA